MEIYVERNGERLGPMSPEEFHEAVTSGTISVDDRAWHEDFDDWIGVSSMLATLPPMEGTVKKRKLAGPVVRVKGAEGDIAVAAPGHESPGDSPVAAPLADAPLLGAAPEQTDEEVMLPMPSGHGSGVASFHRDKSTYEKVDREDRIPIFRVRLVGFLILLAAAGSWFMPWFSVHFNDVKVSAFKPVALFADIEKDKIEDADLDKLRIEERTISRIAILRIAVVAGIAFTFLVGLTVARAAFYPDDAFRGSAFLMLALAGAALFTAQYTYDIHIDGTMYETVVSANKEMAESYGTDIRMDSGFFVCLGSLLLALCGLLLPAELLDTSTMEILRIGPAAIAGLVAAGLFLFALGKGNQPFSEDVEPHKPADWRYMLEL